MKMSSNICEIIENDEFCRALLDGDDLPTAYASLSFADQIQKLTKDLETISGELQSQVREQHGALLSQASHAGKLGTALDTVCGHMERLQAGANRLKHQVNVPFELVKNQTHILQRLHDASHLLRKAGRFLQIYRKLQSSKDATVQATLLNELEPLTEDAALARIDFIQEEKANVLVARQRMNNLAQRDLLQGLQTGNNAQVTTNLQILSNLQTLSKCILNLLDTFNADIKLSIKVCFSGANVASLSSKKPTTSSGRDNKNVTKGPGKTPTLVTSQHFRTRFWAAIEWLFDDDIHSHCVQIVYLQNCLANIQNITIGDDDTLDVETMFWSNLEALLRQSFADCPMHIGQCLQQDLPKLMAAARGLQAKFGVKFVFSDKIFESLEAGYLEQCAMNMKSSLTGVECPTQDAVDSLIRSAATELSAAMVDNRLCLLVAGAFNACCSDFLSKIEAHVKLGTDSKQVIDVPNAAQIQNTLLANCVYYHNQVVVRMIHNLGSNFVNTAAAENIMKDLKKGKTLVLAIVQQLMESMHSAVNVILLSVHREPGLNNDRPLNSSPSLYMKELHDFLLRTWNLHIVTFNDKQSIENCGKELAEQCIELFVRNVAIIRPISMNGRNRLKSDCAHLETALKPLHTDITSFGRPYRQLRALASLLTLQADELAKQSVEPGGSVPTYVVLFLLFGHAGPDLTSPHTAAGWSNEKLLQWLDGHTSDRERLELINGAMQKYRTIVRQKNIAQYDPIYPCISNFLEKANAELRN